MTEVIYVSLGADFHTLMDYRCGFVSFVEFGKLFVFFFLFYFIASLLWVGGPRGGCVLARVDPTFSAWVGDRPTDRLFAQCMSTDRLFAQCMPTDCLFSVVGGATAWVGDFMPTDYLFLVVGNCSARACWTRPPCWTWPIVGDCMPVPTAVSCSSDFINGIGFTIQGGAHTIVHYSSSFMPIAIALPSSLLTCLEGVCIPSFRIIQSFAPGLVVV